MVLSYWFFSKAETLRVYLSLVPIAAGVGMVTMTTIGGGTAFGVIAAFVAAGLKVLQNICTKNALDLRVLSFFELHFVLGAASLVVLAVAFALELVLSAESLSLPTSAALLPLLGTSFAQWTGS